MGDSHKIVVIGGVACGCKAAARARRLDPQAEITIVEQGSVLSYAGCGLPYYIQGKVGELRDLTCTPVGVPRNPTFFGSVKGIRALLNTRATRIDRDTKTIDVVQLDTGVRETLPYGQLVLAMGGRSVMLPIEGTRLDYVFGLRELRNASAIRDALASGKIQKAVIVGGGLIGLEMSEALRAHGLDVTVVELLPHVLLGLLDVEMAMLLEKYLLEQGIHLVCGERVVALQGDSGSVERVVTDQRTLQAQLALIAVGVRPNAQLAVDAGLETGPHGGILVDERMQTSDPAIYAGGDCVESRHLITGDWAYVPLGSTANKHGRVIGTNLAGGADRFPGILGTAIVKVFGYTVARTGLTEQQARDLGYEVVSCVVPGADRPHYYPGSQQIILKLIADAKTRKVLGAQILGPGEVAKRIDVLTTAMSLGATVDQVANLDLAYAPPYSEALDNVIHAANGLRNILDGVTRKVTAAEIKARLDSGEDFLLLDVRSPQEYEAVRIEDPRVKLLPLGKLRSSLTALPKDKPIVTFCKVSLRGYEAERILSGAGFTDVAFMEGGITTWPYALRKAEARPVNNPDQA
jgi:NADPH-dependent 2,4-dienoyl-CoA reductase/sulfur reductase-like enzyme/rhodanese-related sulfurtransferase